LPVHSVAGRGLPGKFKTGFFDGGLNFRDGDPLQGAGVFLPMVHHRGSHGAVTNVLDVLLLQGHTKRVYKAQACRQFLEIEPAGLPILADAGDVEFKTADSSAVLDKSNHPNAVVFGHVTE